MKEIITEATVEKLDDVIDFVDEQLEAVDCPMKIQVQLNIAVEEIFVNIASYAYHPGIGEAAVRVEFIETPLTVILTFLDSGNPFDPLAKADPDDSAVTDENKIGGFGIFMVKKSMDEVQYEYKNGQNILTIKKEL